MHSFITKCSSKIKKLAAVRVPILGKNYINICICNCIINTTSLKLPNEDFYICHLPHYYYNHSSCPRKPLLINYIFSMKSRLKHADVDITCFSKDAKSSLKKH